MCKSAICVDVRSLFVVWYMTKISQDINVLNRSLAHFAAQSVSQSQNGIVTGKNLSTTAWRKRFAIVL